MGSVMLLGDDLEDAIEISEMGSLGDVATTLENRVADLRKAWPKKPIKAAAMIDVLKTTLTACKEILSRKVGDKFSVSTGLLSFFGIGKSTYEITQKDRDAAAWIVDAIENRLPRYGNGLLDAGFMNTIRGYFEQVILTGSYAQGPNWTEIVVDDAKRRFAAVAEAVVELPKTIQKAGQTITTGASKMAFGMLPTWVKVAVPVGGVLLIYGVYRILKAAAPVVTPAAQMYVTRKALGGVGGRSRRRRRARRVRGAALR